MRHSLKSSELISDWNHSWFVGFMLTRCLDAFRFSFMPIWIEIADFVPVFCGFTAKVEVVNLSRGRASRRRMQMTKCIASCRFDMSLVVVCKFRSLLHDIFHALFYCWNCVASLCVYLVLINVRQSCKSLCSPIKVACLCGSIHFHFGCFLFLLPPPPPPSTATATASAITHSFTRSAATGTNTAATGILTLSNVQI